MRLTPRVLRPARPDRGVCDERRSRRHGYQLRCLEPAGHDGPHRWTPELVEPLPHRDVTRPPSLPIRRTTASVVHRVARILDPPEIDS